jgi:competence protein ComEA
MKKWIEVISHKIGFTQTEISIILFLLVTFLIGLVITYIKESNNDTSYLEMDYTAEDSLFNLAVGTVEMDDSSSVADSQKTVASKNGLWDFGSGNKREKVKRKVDSLPKEFDINHATVEQLMTLPGIGKNTAQNIFNYRLKNGDYKKANDLMKVKGIGKTKLDKLRKIIIIK